MLPDIVSKNGNLLLNFPISTESTLHEQAEWTAKEIGKWLKVKGETIYGTNLLMKQITHPDRRIFENLLSCCIQVFPP